MRTFKFITRPADQHLSEQFAHAELLKIIDLYESVAQPKPLGAWGKLHLMSGTNEKIPPGVMVAWQAYPLTNPEERAREEDFMRQVSERGTEFMRAALAAQN